MSTLAQRAVSNAGAAAGLAVLLAGSACSGGLALSAPRPEVRPEVTDVSLEVREFGPRKAELFLQVTMGDAGEAFCPKSMHLEWMINEWNFAASSHALSGECVRQEKTDIPVEASLSYLAMPMGGRRRADTSLAVQGVLVVERESTKEETRIYFSASAPLDQPSAGIR